MFASFFNATNYFDRPFLERDGYAVKEKDGRLIMKVNVLGLGKDNIKINVSPARTPNYQILSVEGEHEDELFGTFKVNQRFTLYKQMDAYVASLQNGILTLEISFVEPVRPDVKVSWK